MSDVASLGGNSSYNGSGSQQNISSGAAVPQAVEVLAATPWAQLWDKAPVVSGHTSRGIDFLERYGNFIKERANIEEEYGAKIKSLAKKYRGKKADADEEFRMFTTASAFQAMLNELESLASQHEVIGERLRGELLPQLTDKCRQLRAGRKRYSQEFDAIEKAFQARVEELNKQKRNYEKAHMDAQNAYIKYSKAEKNLSLSRLEVEKAKQNASTKNNICEQNKQNYAAQLATTNQAKFEHFNVLLPKLLDDMRRLDVDRIQFTKFSMLESVKAETGVMNILQRCYTDMNTAIGTIDPERDTHMVVEQTKTGYAHPEDFLFEDLGPPDTNYSDDAESFDGSTLKRPSSAKHTNGKGIPRKQSIKMFNNPNNNGTMGSQHNSSGSSMGEYGTLPPQQRCRRIQQKLVELTNDLDIKKQSQAGLERMHSVYTQNPKMGDAQEVAKQLEQNRRELEYIAENIKRFENLLLNAQSELNQPLGGHHNTTTNSTVGSSSPSNSSPRGSAGSILTGNGHQLYPGNSLNGNGIGVERGSSYSEASSVSSGEGCAPAHALANGFSNLQQPPTATISQQSQVQQTASTTSTSGFSSTAPTPVSSAHQQQQQQIQHIDADFYEECDGPSGATNREAQQSDMILGTAIVVYSYDAAQDEASGTTISIRENDQLLLLERDVGDGWTRVRHQRSHAEGFVPTSYLECKWYKH